jgi:hypothetical protein
MRRFKRYYRNKIKDEGFGKKRKELLQKQNPRGEVFVDYKLMLCLSDCLVPTRRREY